MVHWIVSIAAMDMSIEGLDDDVGRRLREQASAAGLSMQQHIRNELTRVASRRSPAEIARGVDPMTRAQFEAIRSRLRGVDAK